MEAQASAVPVIAAAAGGAPELVEHHETGLLVPPNDVAAFAAALAELAGSPELARLGERGRQRASLRTWRRSLLELREALAAALDEGSGEPSPAALIPASLRSA